MSLMFDHGERKLSIELKLILLLHMVSCYYIHE